MTLVAQESCKQLDLMLYALPLTNNLLSSSQKIDRVPLSPWEAGPAEVQANFVLKHF
jgi:hypothetical protein